MNVFCQTRWNQKPFFLGVFNFWKNVLFQQFSASFGPTLTACGPWMTNPILNLETLANSSYNYERFLPSKVKSGTFLSWCIKFLEKNTKKSKEISGVNQIFPFFSFETYGYLLVNNIPKGFSAAFWIRVGQQCPFFLLNLWIFSG